MASQFTTPLILPTPTRPRFPGLFEVLPSLLMTLLAAPPIALPIRHPIESMVPPPARPIYVQQDQVQNLVIRANLSATRPFAAVDLQNPVQKPRDAVSGQNFNGNRIAPTGVAPIAFPFSLQDFPNPTPRGFDLASHSLTVITIQGFAPFKFINWENPSPRLIYPQQEQKSSQLTLGIPRAAPLNFLDWQNPPKRPTSYPDLNLPAALTLGLAKPAPPFFLNDQPNPSRLPVSYPDHNQEIPLVLGLGAPPPPFKQLDQPNPSRRQIYDQDFNRGLSLEQGIPVPPTPFVQVVIDSNPIQGRERAQPDLIPNLLTSTLIIPPAALPFNQYDHPTPPRMRTANNYGTWVFGSNVLGLFSGWSLIGSGSGAGWNPVLPSTSSPLTADSTLYTADSTLLTADQTLIITGLSTTWSPIATGNTSNWNSIGTTVTPNILGGVS